MKKIYSLFVATLITGMASAQVGINNPSPDENAVLDLKSNNKGLLIPRMSTSQREGMSSVKFSQGMMVYDTDLDILFVGYGNGANSTKWYAMNPWKTESRTNNNTSFAHMTTMTAPGIAHGYVGIGTSSPTEKLDVNGGFKASGKVTAVGDITTNGKFVGKGTVPLGGIIMWSGTTPPAGWALCNGDTIASTNNRVTPDLRGRFIVGYDPGNGHTDYHQPGNLSVHPNPSAWITGKSSLLNEWQKTLSIANMPTHSHGVTANGHNHGVSYSFGSTTGSGSHIQVGRVVGTGSTGTTALLVEGTSQGNLKIKDSKADIAIGDKGSGTAFDIRPPYYVLAFIMRVY